MTDKPFRPIKVGRIQLRFFVKCGIERPPTQQPEGVVAPILISTPEATTYDLIRYATSIGGIERAAETIRPLLPMLRDRELKCVLAAENEPAVAQRLEFVIEACGNKSLAKGVSSPATESQQAAVQPIPKTHAMPGRNTRREL